MNRSLLNILVCPACSSSLRVHDAHEQETQIREGRLGCTHCGAEYPIRGGIVRFVQGDDYAETFGRQWRRFHTEQLDSRSGTTLSYDRFYEVTRWRPDDLAGKLVLDVGCGAGRFTEIALEAGAHVVAMDLSSSVDACYQNLQERFADRLDVVQASIYDLPFPMGVFDRVYCIGVIQHTPRPMASVRAIARMVRPGGHLAMWIYERCWKALVGIYAWKYLLRTVTRRMAYSENYALSWMMTLVLCPLWLPMTYLGLPGKLVLRCLPVAAGPYAGKRYHLWHLVRCVVMDTLDMYSPAYDIPLRFGEVRDLLNQCGFVSIEHTCKGFGIRGVRGECSSD